MEKAWEDWYRDCTGKEFTAPVKKRKKEKKPKNRE
jgi:hypothetical protein